MGFSEKDVDAMQKNELNPDDIFLFQCKMCGNCCRSRSEPILLTGADIYRVAAGLDVPMSQVVEKHTTGTLGSHSNLPVVLLRERLDGSCSLLRKGHCMVQHSKPAVCALFPLGRYCDFQSSQFHYFLQPWACPKGTQGGKPWLLREWLDMFRIRETEESSLAWTRLIGGIGAVTHRLSPDKISGQLLDVLLNAMYFGYTTDRPYVEQVEEHMAVLKDYFRCEWHKTVRFDGKA